MGGDSRGVDVRGQFVGAAIGGGRGFAVNEVARDGARLTSADEGKDVAGEVNSQAVFVDAGHLDFKDVAVFGTGNIDARSDIAIRCGGLGRGGWSFGLSLCLSFVFCDCVHNFQIFLCC